jgi:hypothetical protein
MQPALVISLYQVTEGFHAFTAVVMIFTLLWIGKNRIRGCNQEIVEEMRTYTSYAVGHKVFLVLIT